MSVSASESVNVEVLKKTPEELREKVAETVVKEDLSPREAEQLVEALSVPEVSPKESKS